MCNCMDEILEKMCGMENIEQAGISLLTFLSMHFYK